VLHVDSGRTWRGGQAQVGYLLAGLAAMGHPVMLAAPGGAPLAEKARTLGIETVDFRPHGDLDAGAALSLAASARRFRAELVHGHAAGAHLAASVAGRMARAQVIITRRLDLPIGQGLLSRWKYRNGVDRYVAISRCVARSLEAGGVEPERIRVVYSGVPVNDVPRADDPLARSAARKALGLPADEMVAGLVGAMTPQKGYDLAIEAMARIRVPLRLVCLGEGPDRESIERQVAALGLQERVVLAGFRSDVPNLLPAFDFLVAPSRHEGLGTSVLEAMAAGLAVVATRVAEFEEVLDQGAAGRLVKAGDVEELAAAMTGLAGDAPERMMLAGRARERAHRYAVSEMVSGNVRVYDELRRS